jgi:hypothetical protein
MRKVRLILWEIVFFVLLLVYQSFSWDYVCIDPGHGGPGAWKYGPNGDERGTCGLVLKLSEQWVNLQVALKCSTLLDEMGQWYSIIMTRRIEQAEILLAGF